jgi:hypothetical protein
MGNALTMRYAILLAIFLAACSPSKKLQRLLDKHPELSAVDTVTVHDTVIVPGDTTWHSAVLRDTLRIESERQVVRVVRILTGSPCDTAAIALDLLAVIKPDTIYRTIEVPVDRIVPCPEGSTVAAWWRVAALFFLLLCIALYLLIRYPAKP